MHIQHNDTQRNLSTVSRPNASTVGWLVLNVSLNAAKLYLAYRIKTTTQLQLTNNANTPKNKNTLENFRLAGNHREHLTTQQSLLLQRIIPVGYGTDKLNLQRHG